MTFVFPYLFRVRRWFNHPKWCWYGWPIQKIRWEWRGKRWRDRERRTIGIESLSASDRVAPIWVLILISKGILKGGLGYRGAGEPRCAALGVARFARFEMSQRDLESRRDALAGWN